MNEEELLQLWQQGDERSFTTLFSYWNPKLVRTLISRTSCSFQDAEDILQESWIKFLHYQNYHDTGSFFAFMNTIAYRTYLDRKRRKKIEFTLFEGGDYYEEEKKYDENLYTELFNSIVEIQPEHHRDALLIRTYRCKSFAEIADMMKLKSVNNSLACARYATAKIKNETKWTHLRSERFKSSN